MFGKPGNSKTNSNINPINTITNPNNTNPSNIGTNIHTNSNSNKSNNFYSIINSINNPNKNASNNIRNTKKSKIIGNDCLDKKGNLKLYKYPYQNKITSVKGGAKIFLFLGSAQECFIDTFINSFRNIEFKDEFRHKIKIDLNDIVLNFVISLFENENKKIQIISIPFCKQKNQSYVELLSKISDLKIYSVFYTFHKDINNLTLEQKREIEFYKYLIHFLGLRDKLIFLCDSKEEIKDEELNEFLIRFNLEENDNLYEKITYSNKIYFLNNEIIYENNDNSEIEKEWEILKTKMEEIQQIIMKGPVELKRSTFFNNLLEEKESNVRMYFHFLNNKEQYYFIYFLGEIKFEKDKSNIIITLINIILKIKNYIYKKISATDNYIEFINDKNYQKIIGALSKISFNNLKKINFENNELFDENNILLNQILSTNLENLDLSSNKFKELNFIFNEKIKNLKILNLSNNNISNLSQFANSKLNNLIDLNLSVNNISDIECLGKENNFDNLQNLNLSDNNIQKLKKINIKSLINLDLRKNEIKEGIKEFMENNKIYSDTLYLKFDNNSVLFIFKNKLNIEFVYKLLEDNYNKILEELNFTELKNVNLLKSDYICKNIDYNVNDSTISCYYDKKNIILNIITKIEFKQLKTLKVDNCKLEDENLKLLDILFTNNLENLDLSFNKFKELNFIFNEKIKNLKILNLSNNNISNLSQFANSKLNNLIDLNLSVNNISDIECLGKENNFDNLQNLNLSDNNIQKLKKINIKSLINLDLRKNEIKEGIKEFMENNKIYSDTLYLKFDNNSVLFIFKNKLNIEFVYKLLEDNYNKILEELNFTELKNVNLLKSDYICKNIDYNVNDSTISCYYDKKNIILNIITKIEFKQLKTLKVDNCKLEDENLKLLDILFTNNLENLDLSNNNIHSIEILRETHKLIELKRLILCHNEISDVTCLSNSKLMNLIELDLSNNKIENIDFLELNENLNNLKKLDLSNNQITKLVKINLKSIKCLNLSENHITDGINDFMLGINNLSQKLILEKLSKDTFKYKFISITDFTYYIKDNIDINQFLKELPFTGIKNLKLKGFDDTNIKFISNETLKDLEELDIKENSLSMISIFDNIYFHEIKKIIVEEKDFNDINLNSFKFFPLIKIERININDKRINIEYSNPELQININNFNILHDDLGEIKEINIDVIPNNVDVFSYDSFINKKLPIFKNIKVDSLNIYYEENKYECKMLFKLNNKKIKTSCPYYLDNLNFLKSDEILSEINDIKFSHVILDQNINFEKDIAYKNLKKLELDNCKIGNIGIIEQIKNKMKNNGLKVSTSSTKLKEKLNDNKYNFIIEDTREELGKYNNLFDCNEPFHFLIEINFDNNYDMIKNVIFKNIKIIRLSNADINNINFLTNNTLGNLRKLYLDKNNIEDISVFDDDKIHFHELELLDLKHNPVKKGLEVLKLNFFKKCLKVKLGLTINELKVTVEYESPSYSLDIFVNSLNDIQNLFEKDKINFGYLSSEETSKFKEIFGFTDEEFNKISQTYNYSNYNSNDYYTYTSNNHFNNSSTVSYSSYNNLTSTKYSNDDEDNDIRPNVIIDNGTGYCKAGLSGEEGPYAVFPTCVGYPKYSYGMVGGDKKEYFVGYDAEYKRGVLKLEYPIENRYINNFDAMEKIWSHVFTNELRKAPEEHNVLLTESSKKYYKENRQKMSQIMFETFNVPGLFIINPAVLSLLGVGKFTGIVMDSGDGGTSIFPIFDGFPLEHGIIRLDISGRDHTKLLMNKLLCEIGCRFETTAEFEIAKAIKEKTCYVALDYEEEFNCFEPFEYELPDGRAIIIKNQRFRCPEALFKPSMVNQDEYGIHQGLYDSIQKCDIDVRRELYNTIVLSGGNTMYPGLPERLAKEIKALAPYSMKEEIRVIASPERKFIAWIGGDILSSISTMESMWVTKTEYEESGATIVERKCFY